MINISLWRVVGFLLISISAYANEIRSEIKHTDIFKDDDLKSEIQELVSHGSYRQASEKLEKLLSFYQKDEKNNNKSIANTLANLGFLYNNLGQYDKAEEVLQKAISMTEKIWGSNHDNVAAVITNLAEATKVLGKENIAEIYLKKALAIYENNSNNFGIASALDSLAQLYTRQARYLEAESLYDRALKIRKKISDQTGITKSLNNLGALYFKLGQYTKAESFFEESLENKIKLIGLNHPGLAVNYFNLGELYKILGNFEKAEYFYKRSLDLIKDTRENNPLYKARVLNNIALLYEARGNYPEAEKLFNQSIDIRINTIKSENNYEVAIAINNLAQLSTRQGKYEKAELLYKKVINIWEATLGVQHPNQAITHHNLAELYRAWNKNNEAIKEFKNAINISEHNLIINITGGSEQQKRTYSETLLGETYGLLSFQLDANLNINSLEANRLAMTTILQRKGRVLDAASDVFASIRQHMQSSDIKLLDKLQEVSSRLSSLYTRGIGSLSPETYFAQYSILERERENLENELSKVSREFHAQIKTISIEDVQKSLPENSSLIEMSIYRPFNLKGIKGSDNFGEEYYVAYVLHPKGEPCTVKLGAAKDIEPKVEAWRRQLDQKSVKVARGNLMSGVKDDNEKNNPGWLLYNEIIAPIRKQCLGDSKTIFFSPDGIFNLVPIGALIEVSGQYLIEDYQITYLSSGRDLLRFQNETPSRSEAVVISDPNYGSNSGTTTKAVIPKSNYSQRRSLDFASKVGTFDRLEKAAEEAKAIKSLLRVPKSQWLTGNNATEKALKNLHSPKILHIATHGFFLANEKDGITNGVGLVGEESQIPIHITENPLLRSGIALAGANILSSGKDDGILTALEASGLNLWGTQLVVLSACETGIGDVKIGEGVYGLRRALVNAGTESQVLSLWRVDDLGTKDLMISYYQKLLAGMGRSEALRQAQLEMIASPNHNHPYYWAAFISSGQWKNIVDLPKKAIQHD